MYQAVLEASDAEAKLCHEVWVECNGTLSLIAHLNNRNVPQVRLDLAFGTDDTVLFMVKSNENAVVHLSGYYLLENEESFADNAETSVKRVKTDDTVCGN